MGAEGVIDIGSTDFEAVSLLTAETGATLRGHMDDDAAVEPVEADARPVDQEGGRGSGFLDTPPMTPTHSRIEHTAHVTTVPSKQSDCATPPTGGYCSEAF